MNAAQRAVLLDLIAEWSGLVAEPFAAARLEEIKVGLDDTWFLWSGPTTHAPGKNGTAYYRVQGPRLIIEFSLQLSRGGDRTDHVHTIYRDPSGGYGRTLAPARR